MHVVVCVRISFHFKAESYSAVWVNHICLSIHLSMDTGCFRLLAIANNAAVNTGVQISL